MYNSNGNNNTGNVAGTTYGAVYNQGSYDYNSEKEQGNKNYYNSKTQATPPNGGLYDEHSLNEYTSTKIRHGFIKKVYSILSLQLLITFGFSTLAVLYKPFNSFLIDNYVLFLVLGIAFSVPIMFSLICFPNVARKYPQNYFLLLAITIGITMLVVLTSAVINSEVFFYSLGTTSVVVIGLTIFAFQTKWDFTGWYVYVFISFLILLFLGIIGIFIRNRIFNLVFAGINAFILSVSIIVDTQLIIGGKHKKFEFTVDDYIFATLSLYMDIVDLFLSIASIFSNAK
ncbi:bax inhibitor 1, putative [Plasmodium berghei]|uniref:Bax inhibitor 1, putative n=2 Tax=Plasmodium berghei TaxID=5821 RepID=A0A509AW28_PLABA|nr:bax inhibitor 1, putative [Plasmodium berghei ANKA]SCM27069.1 bax inhibitor 1, putative [Plasmodium berghei]SCN28795.1 bax inhibitor 1, putative [Plasmodium berghei]SCO63085.1 bax inhibitor 1, putative [Plasmodium berghei]SCO64542.1 bax inhibitor 1, putative [Plasmodium berghei]VUC58678.1 bax inhibitor 1, putative [Plasmodium berghei ANKA]|eukprot:XP_034424441.1 bax inhibitor 1, putative [Plasmodium berghei ANKA]